MILQCTSPETEINDFLILDLKQFTVYSFCFISGNDIIMKLTWQHNSNMANNTLI